MLETPEKSVGTKTPNTIVASHFLGSDLPLLSERLHGHSERETASPRRSEDLNVTELEPVTSAIANRGFERS